MQTLSDYWEPVGKSPAYDLSIYGPNGYVANFRGASSSEAIEGRIRYDRASGDVYLTLINHWLEHRKVAVANRYSSDDGRTYTLAPRATVEDRWELAQSSGWFDLSITSPDDALFLRRFAGHVETAGRVRATQRLICPE